MRMLSRSTSKFVKMYLLKREKPSTWKKKESLPMNRLN
jgi:hypothetical protein